MLDFLLGYLEISVCGEEATVLLEACRTLGVSPRRQRRRTGALVLRLLARDAARVLAHPRVADISCTVVARGGLPLFLRGLLRRPALLVGLLLAVALITLSALFVWEVQVTGLADIPEAEMRELLAREGIAVGRFIPTLATDEAALALRAADARLAYVSVNRQGTVLLVSVVEAVLPPPKAPTAPANLVAVKDGVVTLPLVFEGKALVRPGDVVRAGDLLATGVLDTNDNGIRLTRAAGSVMARTEETFTVTVPFSYTVSSPTGRARYELSLKFFGTERKVFKNSGNLTGNYVIIENEKDLRAWNGRVLPAGWRLVTYRECETVTCTRTAREALALANEALAAKLAAAATHKTLLSKTVETVVSDEGVTLVCTALFEEDIARVAEFEIDR
ncbi:MAG: sporulation protein YqfD [Clostridia bacterium]|nr:sporulation protein YqfD [Clostridia bacterium]